MRRIDPDSVFETEALRRTILDALDMYRHLGVGPSSQVRFDGRPRTLGKRIERANVLLRLIEWREDQLFEEGWDEITFWLDKEGMNWSLES